MLFIAALLTLGFQAQPPSEDAIYGSFGREAPFEGEATLEACLAERRAGLHSACRPVLEPEAALVPDLLFNASIETPSPRLEGWLDVVCGSDRLAAGQTEDACRDEKRDLHTRSWRARLAMTGRTPGGVAWTVRDPVVSEPSDFDVAFANSSQLAPSPTQGAEPPPPPTRERCERRADSWRDEDTGDSESRYSLTCSWGSGDTETEARAREALDAVMGRD